MGIKRQIGLSVLPISSLTRPLDSKPESRLRPGILESSMSHCSHSGLGLGGKAGNKETRQEWANPQYVVTHVSGYLPGARLVDSTARGSATNSPCLLIVDYLTAADLSSPGSGLLLTEARKVAGARQSASPAALQTQSQYTLWVLRLRSSDYPPAVECNTKSPTRTLSRSVGMVGIGPRSFTTLI